MKPSESDLELAAGSERNAPDEQRIERARDLIGPEAARRIGVYSLPADFVLSVVIPVYNENKTLVKVIDRVRGCGVPVEMIIVDDGSTDGTREVLAELQSDPANADLQIVLHEKNQGKGAALKTGFLRATGDVVIIQDADMEYDPKDFRWLLQPIIEGDADVVFGSRYSGPTRPVSPMWHTAANRVVTFCSNMFTGLMFTDVETCYKMFRRDVIARIQDGLRERGFGIEIEMTAKLARMRDVRFYERPIRYNRRTYAEGKKIGWRDGVWALWCIIRY